MAGEQQLPGEQGERIAGSYRHALRVIPLILVAAGVAVAARQALLPASWGQRGPYRERAAVEARARAPRHVVVAVCERCHEENGAKHRRGAHRGVACAACHGVGDRHARFHRKNAPLTRRGEGRPAPTWAKLKIPIKTRRCLTCHGELAARPRFFPQVERGAHLANAGVKKRFRRGAKPACRHCHNPHEPLGTGAELVRLKRHRSRRRAHASKVTPCLGCHRVIARVAASVRAHRKIPCRRCHVMFTTKKLAGRVLRDGGPGLCLLCHRKSRFRDKRVRTVAWPRHRLTVKNPDRRKVCVDCHRAQIHADAATQRRRATQTAHGSASQPGSGSQPGSPSQPSSASQPRSHR